jgi:hypothetical protein
VQKSTCVCNAALSFNRSLPVMLKCFNYLHERVTDQMKKTRARSRDLNRLKSRFMNSSNSSDMTLHYLE